MSKLLTVREAAEILHLSESTVRVLCTRRKLRHERHGAGRGKVLIPEDALEEYRQRVTVPARTGEAEVPCRLQTRPHKLRNLSLD